MTKGWHKQSKRHSRASKEGWKRRKAGMIPLSASRIRAIQKDRSRFSRALDNSAKHKRVINISDPENKQWANDPGKMDIRGVDYPEKVEKKSNSIKLKSYDEQVSELADMYESETTSDLQGLAMVTARNFSNDPNNIHEVMEVQDRILGEVYAIVKKRQQKTAKVETLYPKKVAEYMALPEKDRRIALYEQKDGKIYFVGENANVSKDNMNYYRSYQGITKRHRELGPISRNPDQHPSTNTVSLTDNGGRRHEYGADDYTSARIMAGKDSITKIHPVTGVMSIRGKYGTSFLVPE